jgi:hypothetical protein
VLKTRAYVNTISQELNLAINKTATVNKNYRNAAAASQAAEIAAAAAQAQTQALVEVLNRIDELCVHLAVTIRKSVLNLPTSQVRALPTHRLCSLRLVVEQACVCALRSLCTIAFFLLIMPSFCAVSIAVGQERAIQAPEAADRAGGVRYGRRGFCRHQGEFWGPGPCMDALLMNA